MDEFAVGEVMQSKRRKPFNIQFRNEKNLGKTIFLVHLKYVLDYIEELPEQLQWLENIDEKNNDEPKPPGPSLKKSQPECNDSEGTASESEIERPTTKKVKCAAKTAPTPAAPQNIKKVAAVFRILCSVMRGRVMMLPQNQTILICMKVVKMVLWNRNRTPKMNHGSLVNCQSSIQFILLPQVAHKHHLIQTLHSPLIIFIWESASEGPGFF